MNGTASTKTLLADIADATYEFNKPFYVAEERNECPRIMALLWCQPPWMVVPLVEMNLANASGQGSSLPSLDPDCSLLSRLELTLVTFFSRSRVSSPQQEVQRKLLLKFVSFDFQILYCISKKFTFIRTYIYNG